MIMNSESDRKFGDMDDIRELIQIFVIALIVSSVLLFVDILAHEGGHGLLVVPAIILNGAVPESPLLNSGGPWNPFVNFPGAALLFVMSFPLGILANGILALLSYKNALIYQDFTERRNVVLFTVFLSFAIINLYSVLVNFFGADFSFVWTGIGFPYETTLFRYLIRVIGFILLPLYIGFEKRLSLPATLATSLASFVGYTLTAEFVVTLLYESLMLFYWWLFIIGLPTFLILVLILRYWIAHPLLQNPAPVVDS